MGISGSRDKVFITILKMEPKINLDENQKNKSKITGISRPRHIQNKRIVRVAEYDFQASGSTLGQAWLWLRV